MIHHIGRILSSRHILHTLKREIFTKEETGKVFLGLIKDWLGISEKFRIVVNGLQETLRGSANDMDAQETFLEEEPSGAFLSGEMLWISMASR